MPQHSFRLVSLGIASLIALVNGGAAQTARAEGKVTARAYVGEFQQNTVGVLDAGSGRLIAHIGVPPGAHGVAVLPDGSRVFVSSDASNTISVIDGVTERVIGTIPTGKQPHGLAIGRGGRFVYASIYGDDQVLEIDPRSLRVLRTFEVPAPHNIAPSPDGEALYVAAQKPGNTGVARIDLRSGRTAAFIATATVPRALGVSPDGRTLVTTQFDSDQVQFYATDPLRLERSVGVGGAPHHVTYTPDGKLVLVVDQSTNDLTVIDARNFHVAATIAVGKKPHWIAPTADSRYAYVTDEGSDEVSLVDLADRDVERTIAAGRGPRKIALAAGAPSDRETPESTGQSGTEATPHSATVNIQGPPPRFAPATLTVEAGTIVRWVNGGKGIHTVTEDDGAWDSGSLAPGDVFTHTFDRKGTFRYYCIPHRSMGMVGTIIVR